MNVVEAMIRYSAMGLEIFDILIITLGAAFSTAIAVHRYFNDRPAVDIYVAYRSQLSRAILLGLEFLVAADIIRTVAMEPTFASVGVLAAIVLIRTFLSFTLEVEVSGKWPWSHGKESDN